MLKIPKGLKKKKKGKKSKRKGEEELFTEEELEKYRREHQSQPQQSAAQPSDDGDYQQHQQQPSEAPKAAPDNDEWSKFNALTTGVDSILNKTKGDLDRIKSTSFFQRERSGPKLVDRTGKELPLRRDADKEGQRWIGFEKQEGHEEGQFEAQEPKAVEEAAAPAVTEQPPSESESEEEDFDDIFDTSYVEAVEKGEVKLALVPDSPEEEADLGPDPFDTSYAEKVIKGPEVSKKGKKLVNIGAAVEVLTGRIDHVTTSNAAIKKAKRRIPRDLLIENPDTEDLSDLQVEEPTSNVKSILDEDADDIPKDIPVDLSVSLHTQFITPSPRPEEEDKFLGGAKDVLDSFDVLAQQDDEDDEFAQLATESLSKPVVAEEAPSPVEAAVEDDSWASFAETKGKPDRPPPPRPSSGPRLPAPADELDDDEFDQGPDPFDTTFAENIVPGRAELKQIEREILSPKGLPNSDSDFDFDPRADEKPVVNNRRKSSVHIHVTDPAGIRESISGYDNVDSVGDLDTLKPIHRDLLGGSSTDLSQLADSPIAPYSASDDNDPLEYSDPFDTSIVDIITAPGKTELKFIEKELLGETEIKRSLSDPDFDPRADDPEPPPSNSPRKPSRPENLFNKSVLFKLPTDEQLLAEKNGKKGKPLTPYYNREASIVDEDVDTQEDPAAESSFPAFEATITGEKPVSSILKNYHAESEIKRSSSDQDLNTEEEEAVKGKFTQLRRHSDFPLNFVRPTDFGGKSELFKKPDFLSITEEDSVDIKLLTPYQEEKPEDELEIDPFDTSLVTNVLLPGKTELRFLESELLKSDELNDPDFDPRSGDPPKADDLLAPSDDVFQVKALTPEVTSLATGFLIDTEENEIDPFDTSIADNLGPGKTELKLLESEFMN